ncbi:DUF4345 family protein [Streptomyces sp. S.PNR 29]|uniref:DUF4345 family protein n=1 Tax=Streptomyces sp. S.PNR 29 TaxID=2973805 RepID=UPI0025AFBD18|nr:DUF4345 family protein [Streptomyces sp. S.PNR 29]MDN0198193.1 DUF4345 family protein [Streptomyces sp. S.PNR 29]
MRFGDSLFAMSALGIGAVALFFLGMGLFGLVAPTALIRPFGIELRVPEARGEVRAVYGGFGVGFGILLGWAALHASGDLRRGIVLAAAVALAGMALGRLVSRAVEGPSAFYPAWFYFWVEVLGAGLLAAAVLG